MQKINSPYLLLVLLLLLCSCFRTNTTADTIRFGDSRQVFNFKGIEDLYRFLTYSENRVPLVSAHRGGPDTGYPENAIETFQRVASKMSAIIECDIALTKGALPVLIHDETLDTTTTGNAKVNQLPLDELNELHVKDPAGTLNNYRIATLEETLRWRVGQVIFTLDVKRN